MHRIRCGYLEFEENNGCQQLNKKKREKRECRKLQLGTSANTANFAHLDYLLSRDIRSKKKKTLLKYYKHGKTFTKLKNLKQKIIQLHNQFAISYHEEKSEVEEIKWVENQAKTAKIQPFYYDIRKTRVFCERR